MELREAFKQFIVESQNGRFAYNSDKTILKHKNVFELFVKWIPTERVQDLNEELLWRYFNKGETTRDWKPSTVITNRTSLSRFLDWCVINKLLKENPIKKIPRPRLIKNTPDYYSEEEIDKILYTVNKLFKRQLTRARNMAMIGIMLLAGLRKGELLKLKITDVDFSNKVIRIRAENAKNRKPRSLNISHKLEELLKVYISLREKKGIKAYSLWVSSNNHAPLTENGYNHILETLSEGVGFKVKSHKCRHTFATYAYKGCKDIMAVKDALGHADLKTTLVYATPLAESTKLTIEVNPINDLF